MKIEFRQYTKSELDRIKFEIEKEFFRGLMDREKTMRSASRHSGYNYHSIYVALKRYGLYYNEKTSRDRDMISFTL